MPSALKAASLSARGGSLRQASIDATRWLLGITIGSGEPCRAHVTRPLEPYGCVHLGNGRPVARTASRCAGHHLKAPRKPSAGANVFIGSPSFEKYDQPDMTPSGFCSSASSTVRSASTARTDCVSEKATMLRAKKRMDDSSAVLESVSNWTYAAIGSEPACFFIREDRSARRCARSWPAFAAARTTMLSTCIGKHNFSASHSRPTRRELFAVVPPWEPVPLSAEEARTFGNPQHLSSYAMLRLDVGRHPCASTWVRMVIIAPRELGQGSDASRLKRSAQGKCAVPFELIQSPRIQMPSDRAMRTTTTTTTTRLGGPVHVCAPQLHMGRRSAVTNCQARSHRAWWIGGAGGGGGAAERWRGPRAGRGGRQRRRRGGGWRRAEGGGAVPSATGRAWRRPAQWRTCALDI